MALNTFKCNYLITLGFKGLIVYRVQLIVISFWNRLPSHTVLAQNILQFKTSLKSIDLSYALLGKK